MISWINFICVFYPVSEEKKRPVESDSERLSRFMEKYKKAVTNLKLQQQQNQQPHQAKKALKYSKKGKNWNVESTNTVLNETTGGDRTSHRNYFNSNDYANGEPALSADVIRDHDRKDRYAKYVVSFQWMERSTVNFQLKLKFLITYTFLFKSPTWKEINGFLRTRNELATMTYWIPEPAPQEVRSGNWRGVRMDRM